MLPSYYEALFTHFHGAVVRVPAPATAFPLRSPGCDFFVTAGARDPAGLAAATEWLHGFWSALQPHTAGVYVNVLEDVGEARVRAAYGANYPRLVALKNQYDPTNFFRLNRNVEPTM